MCAWETGENEKGARGGRWEGQIEEERHFPLPIIHCALAIFLLLLLFLEFSEAEPLQRKAGRA